jgi:hypothetical protein
LKSALQAFDTRTSLMYDRYPRPISSLAKEGERKRRKQNNGIEHPTPLLESIDSYQPATQERERKKTREIS